MSSQAVKSFADIQNLSIRNLTDLYNKLTGSTLKKFENRAAAEKRTWAAVEPTLPKASPTVATKIRKEAPQPAILPQKEEKVTDIVKKRDLYYAMVIQMTVSTNHKRPNTRAFDKFALLLEFNGRTVGEYAAQEGQHENLDIEKGWPFAELRYARDRGYTKLVKPEDVQKCE